MKSLRLWFVVMLAVLLPLRGVMAATMPCTPFGAAGQVERHVHAPGAGHEGARLQADAHDHAAHGVGHSAHDHGGEPHAPHDAGGEKCTMCSASCATPPLPSAATGVDAPALLATASFPDLCAPAPTFQSEGPERPPRTT